MKRRLLGRVGRKTRSEILYSYVHILRKLEEPWGLFNLELRAKTHTGQLCCRTKRRHVKSNTEHEKEKNSFTISQWTTVKDGANEQIYFWTFPFASKFISAGLRWEFPFSFFIKEMDFSLFSQSPLDWSAVCLFFLSQSGISHCCSSSGGGTCGCSLYSS